MMLTLIAAIAILSLVFSTLAWYRANEAHHGEHRVQSRLNGFFDTLGMNASGLRAKLERFDYELFRRGEYPDQGLRQWARKWRQELRDIANEHERKMALLANSQVIQLETFRDYIKYMGEPSHGHDAKTPDVPGTPGSGDVAGDPGPSLPEAHDPHDYTLRERLG